MAKEKKHKMNGPDFLNAAIKCLTKKHDCRIETNTIVILSKDNANKKNDLGNGSWKYIDGLVNHFWFRKSIK